MISRSIMMYRSATSRVIQRPFVHTRWEHAFKHRLPTSIRGFRSSTPAHATVDFKLTDVGEGIAEVEIIEWFVKPGDEISEMDPVCSVQSDKADVSISSRYDGVVKSLGWKAGDMAKVGSTLLTIDIEGEETVPETPKQSESDQKRSLEKPDEAPQVDKDQTSFDAEKRARFSGHERSHSIETVLTPQNSSTNPPSRSSGMRTASRPEDRIATTPAVRRLASEHDIDLKLITPTGPGGRILKEDLLHYIRSGMTENGTKSADAARDTHKEALNIESQSTKPALHKDIRFDEAIPVRGIQRQMFLTMTRSLEIPHFNYMDEYIADGMIQFRKQLIDSLKEKISFLPIIIKATSLSLEKYPAINAHLTNINGDPNVTIKSAINIGVAVDTDNGLIVPVIHNAHLKSIKQIASEIVELQAKAKEKKLTEHDLKGATFTVSNIGSIGGTYMSPVVSSPQVAIVAIGRMKKVLDAETQQLQTVMNFSFAADHRVVDGATVARFSNQIKSYLENPISLLADMK